MRHTYALLLLLVATHARACEPDAFTLCLLDRFRITVEDRAGGGHERATVGARGSRGARGSQAGTFALYSPEYWDVLVNVFDNCRATKTFIITYVSMNTDPYDLTVTDERTDITKTFSTPNGRQPAKYDKITFHCN